MQKREFVTILEAGDGFQRYSMYVQKTGISGVPGKEERQSFWVIWHPHKSMCRAGFHYGRRRQKSCKLVNDDFVYFKSWPQNELRAGDGTSVHIFEQVVDLTAHLRWTGRGCLNCWTKRQWEQKKEPVRRINRHDVYEKQLELAADKSLRREKVKSCMFPCRSHQVSINSSSRGKKQTDRWDVCQCVAVRIKYVIVRTVCVCTFEVV